MEAVALDNATRRFGTVTAVDGLTLSVRQGELFGLVGSDGAGKTTTLRMLAGVLDPTAGGVRVLGRQMPGDAEAVRGDIGYMSQRFGLYPDLTVEENLRFYADIFDLSRRERDARMSELLEFSRMAPFRNRRAGKLSGGMKQKLGLACALIHTPRLLLLDEPTNGVDPVSRREFWRILHRLLKQGVTILVATAYLDEAERCSRVGLIHQGRLIGCDTPRALAHPLRGTIVEIRIDSPRETLRHLRSALPQASFTLFGDRIHGSADPAAVARLLPGAEVRLAEPNLEDVLVAALTGGRS